MFYVHFLKYIQKMTMKNVTKLRDEALAERISN